MKKTVSMTSFTVILFLAMLFPSLASADVDKSTVMKKVSGLQVPFIENQGQVRDASVRYYADTFAGTVYVTDKGEIVYNLVKREPASKSTKDRDINNSALRPGDSISKAMVLRESLEGLKKTGPKGETASRHPVGINKSVTKVNYFSGKKENWRTGIPTWQEVSLGEVYKGIELKLRAYGNNVEKLFTVRPGSSVEKIRLKIEGAKGLSVNKNGELEIDTALGTVKMTKPVAFQEIDGKRVEVAANYVVSGQSQGLTYGFQVGKYDNTKPLVIDPLVASTFLGGSSEDNALSIVIGGSGNVYIAGYTYVSLVSDFQTTPGAYDTTPSAGYDAFISKFDTNLETLLASTYLGGKGHEGVFSMTMDLSGNVYVAGITDSLGFPTTPGAYARTPGSYDPESGPTLWFSDGFISIFDGNLESLLVSTYVGLGSNDDFPLRIDMALDNDRNVYIASSVLCSYTGYCALIAKFDAKLENRLASTLVAGRSNAGAITIDDIGNVYVAGETFSSDFETTPDAYDISYNGGRDTFISKFDGKLENLLGATFLGGSGWEFARSITIGDSGNVYVSGDTTSSDFPTTPGAYDTSFDGKYDAFISKFDSALETLLASTFLGGDDNDGATSVMLGGGNDLYVTGYTSSADFPTTPDAYDTSLDGDSDAFISKFDINLETLLSSTYLGGITWDSANSLTLDSNGDVYVTGRTSSSDFPTTPEAFDTNYNGGDSDAFVSKFTFGEESGHKHKNECR